MAQLLLMPLKILILGGTKTARVVAALLVAQGHDVTTSLAGVTTHPVVPTGKLRIGGFGGSTGLREHVLAGGYEILIDATHPFAAQISDNAETAVQGTGVRHIRLERPAWEKVDGDIWIPVDSVAHAAEVLPSQASVFLTVGRKGIAPFLGRHDLKGIIRTIEPPAEVLPAIWHLVLERPPFSVDSEIELLRHHRITHVVSKNSGGQDTADKITAARVLKIPVVMIGRPIKRGGEVLHSPAAIVDELS
jgi:precorrin-6A/cobalt-precorrin-6A reductase